MATNKGHDNLIPISERSDEERREIAIKGGKAKAESERRRKRIKEVADILLALPIKSGDMTSTEDIRAIGDETNTDVITGITVRIIKKALDGDLRAVQLLFTLTGDYSTRYDIHSKNTFRDDGSLKRLEADMAEIFERNNRGPKSAEEIQADEDLKANSILMFTYLGMYEEPDYLARNLTKADVIKVKELFETADDNLKIAFVRRCYGKNGKLLTDRDCIALFDNSYYPRIMKGYEAE